MYLAFLKASVSIPSKACLTCQVYSFLALHRRSYCGLGSAVLKEKEL